MNGSHKAEELSLVKLSVDRSISRQNQTDRRCIVGMIAGMETQSELPERMSERAVGFLHGGELFYKKKSATMNSHCGALWSRGESNPRPNTG